ncbi:MAG TPA: VWA domain-containing protein [Bacteroidales bacterium]|nr:VWA domain-containing protein [Bacteroidales bacterium]
MSFVNKEYLWLLLVIIPMIAWYIIRQSKHYASMQISSAEALKSGKKGVKTYLRHVLFVLRIFAIAAIIIVIARPQNNTEWDTKVAEGIDIIMSMDVSTSMLAEDFQPNRLEAAKDVAIQFISDRPNDRIGLVIFAGESFTQCPLTTDHNVVINLMNEINCELLDDGTAIGDGLATSVNRLKNSNAISKVIILLTDGVNNKGSVAPLTGAEIAKTFGIRVYTIGVGTIGSAPYPFKTQFGTQYQNIDVKIDEEMLQEIASLTGGKYFRATDNKKLKDIYEEIDLLEKTKIQVTNYSKPVELFEIWVIIAIAILILEILLRLTILKNIP